MTNQALPEAIRRQVEEAAALEQSLYGQQAPEEGNTEAEPEQPAEPQAVEVQVEQPEQVAQTDEDSYRRKYDVLRGKYDAEIPRLHAQVRDLSGNLQQAIGEIERIKAIPQSQPAEPPVSDNDAETFGEDLTEAIDRRAKRMASELVGEQTRNLMQHLQQLEARLGNVDQQVEISSQDRFFGNLAKLVPDYEAVNGEQGFLDWLGEADPVYGVPRQAALDAASERMDAERTAQVFMAYKQLTGKQVQSQQKQQVRQELERQTAPNAPRSSAQTQPAGKFMTRDEYAYAFDPRTIRELGPTKAEELMAEADRAYQEGRVQW